MRKSLRPPTGLGTSRPQATRPVRPRWLFHQAPVTVSDYWNHNTAFHWRIMRDAALRGGNALDVGCGGGLLLARLATVCRYVVGSETNGQTAARTRRRLERAPQTEVLLDDIMDPDLPQRIGTLETATCVATLRHLPLEPALVGLSQLVTPGGRLIVVGLATDKSLWDWTLSTLTVLPLHVVGVLQRESLDINVVTRVPRESLTEIRRAAARLLSEART